MNKTTEKTKKKTVTKTAASKTTKTPKKASSESSGLIDKSSKILVLVESPNKCATIQKILQDGGYKNAKVMASVGHFVEIKDGGGYKNTGIYPTKDFKINFVVSPGKKEVFKKMQEAVAKADYVYICSDEDREGEAIGGHMKDFLKIPSKKCGRATFHEITAPAVLAALASPRELDQDLIGAAHARQALDKIMGYALSPIARTRINCRSVGRCQSAGLKLVVEREKEIRAFVPEKYFELFLLFKKKATEFRAKYCGTTKKEIRKLPSLEECEKIKKACAGKPYFVDTITCKQQNDFPKPPFTTSTFQQEANRVYGMSIDAAMSCAQRLFEGIEISGSHVALITYIRTDDCSMSPDFAVKLGDFVKNSYGKKYYAEVKKPAKTSETAQEAHECLRIINLDMPPETLSKYISDKNLLKIYKLIWERTIMSSMAPAIISDTQYDIHNGDHVFVMHSREVIFDGYRRVHVDAEDEITKDDLIKETFIEGEVLKETQLVAEAKETTPPKRFTEATFVKELDKRGIGRPSTFATIIKTILAKDRGYCVLQGKEISPTEKGIELSEFLDKSFPDLFDLKYTSRLEADLDEIATGKIKEVDFLKTFYDGIEEKIKKIEPEEAKVCPNCGAIMVKRHSAYGYFWGCSGYPKCKTIVKF